MRPLAFSFLLIPALVWAQPPASPPPFKTVQIRYESKQKTKDPSGGVIFKSAGSEIRYIDVANNRRRVERRRVRSQAGTDVEELSIEIHDEIKTVILDPQFQAGRRFRHHAGLDAVWRDRLGESAKPIKEEKVKGKLCQVYETGGAKVWIWNGVLLKQEMKNDTFHYVIKAKSIKEDVSFAPDLFTVPPDYDILDVNPPEINLPGSLFN